MNFSNALTEFSALSQKSSIEEAPSKRSSLKSTMKTVPTQSTAPQSMSATSKWNAMGTQYSNESVPDEKRGRSFITFDMFSIFVVILIITLVLLNLYLFVELYVLKNKQNDGIEIDRALLDKLAAIG